MVLIVEVPYEKHDTLVGIPLCVPLLAQGNTVIIWLGGMAHHTVIVKLHIDVSAAVLSVEYNLQSTEILLLVLLHIFHV